MELKIYKVLFILLILIAIIVIGLIGIKYIKSYLIDKENKKTVETFSNILNEKNINEKNDNEEITMNGYKVIGVVRIPKIQIEYPILDLDTYNPEETKIPMKISIVKYWGGKVNENGNLSIAGHNNYDGTMFGKTKKLEIGDMVELTDLNNLTIQYQIYDKFITNPNDVTILATKDQMSKEVTLITCTNGNKERLILKAKEILKK